MKKPRASDRIYKDIRELRRLQRRVVFLGEQLEKLRPRLPAIPFSADHAAADFQLSQATDALRRILNHVIDSKHELQFVRLPDAYDEELDLLRRKHEQREERAAIQAENKLADAPGFSALRKQIRESCVLF